MIENDQILSLLARIEENQRKALETHEKHLALAQAQLERSNRTIQESIELQRFRRASNAGLETGRAADRNSRRTAWLPSVQVPSPLARMSGEGRASSLFIGGQHVCAGPRARRTAAATRLNQSRRPAIESVAPKVERWRYSESLGYVREQERLGRREVSRGLAHPDLAWGASPSHTATFA